MLESITFWDCKKRTTQTRNEWLVPLHHIGIALGVGSDILKSIIRYHLPQ